MADPIENQAGRWWRKKPVVIEAMQMGEVPTIVICRWLQDHGASYTTDTHRTDWHQDVLHIITLEGLMRAEPGDFIIRGVKGEFYPCKPDIFEATYEPIDAGPHIGRTDGGADRG